MSPWKNNKNLKTSLLDCFTRIHTFYIRKLGRYCMHWPTQCTASLKCWPLPVAVNSIYYSGTPKNVDTFGGTSKKCPREMSLFQGWINSALGLKKVSWISRYVFTFRESTFRGSTVLACDRLVLLVKHCTQHLFSFGTLVVIPLLWKSQQTLWNQRVYYGNQQPVCLPWMNSQARQGVPWEGCCTAES